MDLKVAVAGAGGTGKTTVALRLSEELGAKLVEAKERAELFLEERKLVKEVYDVLPAVDKEKCLRCNLCSAVCPTRAMVRDWEGYPLALEGLCTSCSSCIVACPQGALVGRARVVARIYEARGVLQIEGRDLKALLKGLEGPWVLDADRPEYALFADVALVLYNDARSLLVAERLARFYSKNDVEVLIIENESREAGPGRIPKGLPPRLDHVLPLLENF
ncbi:MAG: hypothetical protein GXO07_06160 [Crenarchaeota archaeon]|nr:hypothetical protein [Thermoproteota archaeon]